MFVRIIGSLILSFILFISCSSDSRKINESQVSSYTENASENKPNGLNIDSRLHNMFLEFISSNPEICNNEIIEKETKTEFIHLIENNLNKGLLDDLPFSFVGYDVMLNRTLQVRKDVGAFIAMISSADSSYTIRVHVQAIIPDSLLRTMKKYDKYKLKGNYKLHVPGFKSLDQYWEPCYSNNEYHLRLDDLELRPTEIVNVSSVK